MNRDDNLAGALGALVLVIWLVGLGIVIGQAAEAERRRQRQLAHRVRELEHAADRLAEIEGMEEHFAGFTKADIDGLDGGTKEGTNQ